MATVITSPADIVNLALSRIGVAERVGSIFEGSRESKVAIDVYSQTRDELLRNGDYDFSKRIINMTLLKQAPDGGYFPPNPWNGTLNPPPPWRFAYAYPDSCIKIRAVKPAPQFIMDFDPQPKVFSLQNDNYFTPPQKVILCNVPDAMLVFTAQVTDPTVFDADFVEAFAAALGRRLAPVLKGMDAVKLAAVDEVQATAVAQSNQG